MAVCTLDDWTDDKSIELIREYRLKPILWDTRHPYFFKKPLKPKAWQEIGSAIGVPAELCKRKMLILMSSFRREKAKIMNSIKKIKGDINPSRVYRSTWFAFKELAFLLDKATERKRQTLDSNDPDASDEDGGSVSGIKIRLLSHDLDSPLQIQKKLETYVTLTKELLSECDTSEEPDETPSPQVLTPVRDSPVQPSQMASSGIPAPPLHLAPQIPGPSQTLSERDEEIKSFTSFIGTKMKKYSETTKNAVQQAICEVIFKADQNFYEKCFEKYTIIDEDPLHKEQQLYDDDKTIIKILHDSDSE